MCQQTRWEYAGKSEHYCKHIGTNLQLGHAEEHLYILKNAKKHSKYE